MVLLRAVVGRKAGEIRRSLRVGFGEIAEEFDRSRATPWPQVLAELGTLAGGIWSVDWGCGNGRHALVLARLSVNVAAVDFSSELAGIAREKGYRAGMDHLTHLVVADVAYAPFRDESFNAVLAVAVIHHIPSTELRLKALSEVRRTAKVGSRAVVTCWSRWQKGFVKDVISTVPRAMLGRGQVGDVVVRWNGFERYYHLFTVGEMRRLLTRSSFKILKCKRVLLNARRRAANILAVVEKQAGGF